MKFLALAFLFSTAVLADDVLLVKPGKLIAEPDLKSPLPAEWQVAKGQWDVKDGEMTAIELKEQKHSAVLWHNVKLNAGIVECEFKFDGASAFILGSDGSRHIGRVTIVRKSMKLTDDSTEVKGVHPGTLLGEAALDLKPGEWYKVRYEWAGDKMAVRIGDKTTQGSSPTLAQNRARWWLAVGGQKLQVRNLKVWDAAQ